MRNIHRIFIAVNPQPKIRQQLFAATDAWRELPIRWTKPEDIHVTLHFIGKVDDDTLSRIAEILPLAAQGVEQFEITLNRIGIGPEKGRARMVWAEGETPRELTQLRQQVQEAVESRPHVLENVGVSDDDTEQLSVNGRLPSVQPFRLHVTLGRMVPFRWTRLAEKPRIERDINISFPVSSIELMESESGQDGSSYTILSSVDLL